MKKKVKALFFVILALSNINILAHTFVPHHYHENKVCNEKIHCQTHSEAHKHSTAGHNHEHDGKNNPDYCISGQVFVIRSNQTDLDFRIIDVNDNWLNNNPFRVRFQYSEIISLVESNYFKPYPFLGCFTHCQFVSNQLGMRAPPTIV